MADQSNTQPGSGNAQPSPHMRPASPQVAADPSRNYERSRPQDESGMGKLDNDGVTQPPPLQPDGIAAAVTNRQPPRQINADSGIDNTLSANTLPPQPDHSMLDEEPAGWDLAPQNANDPAQRRHPRTEGKGGTP